MIDFRYHIVSIVAIFFALGAGVVLGAGPLKGTASEVVASQAEKDRQQLSDARDELTQLKALDKYRDDYVAKVTAGLTNGKLANKKIAIVTMPSADSDLSDGVQAELEKAGGVVTTKVALDAKLFDTGQRQLVESLVQQLVTADIDVPKDSTTYQRAGLLLARGIAAKEEGKIGDADSTRIVSGLTGAKLLSLKPSQVKDRASLIVVIAAKPPTTPPDNATFNDALDFIKGLDTGSGGVVVAGTPDSAADGGLIKALRSDSEATKIVSSVDVADLPAGQMTVVFALVEQAGGKAGQYGAINAKNGVAPSAVQIKDN
ncbi:copper transporter [Kribbella kalugense]|uniref:Copper transport outer membrane protein MctB n=1 Tax=Kribbella kalugense TaxID=2512221 RepID=A0A4R7ZA55_9ACTN|nr:copper transporter [Kribbella kalugense]TDW13972.1 copper transport outer membrane protein MctB [Kribbella kalugense]